MYVLGQAPVSRSGRQNDILDPWPGVDLAKNAAPPLVVCLSER
jgi:hypothetical protein